MNEAKIKPTFKRKFSSHTVVKNGGSKNSKEGKRAKEEESVTTVTEDQNVTLPFESKKKQSSEKRGKKKSEKKETVEEVAKPVSLSDSQYNEIFARVLAGGFLDLDERLTGSQDVPQSEENLGNIIDDGNVSKKNTTEKKKKKLKDKQSLGLKKVPSGKGKKEQRFPLSTAVETIGNEKDVCRSDEREKGEEDCTGVTPAESFTKSISQKSPNTTKRTNEVTPVVSPQDQAESNVLAMKPKPKQMQKKLKANTLAKRKSLDYVKDNKLKVQDSEQQHFQSGSEENEHGKGIWVQCTSCDKWRFLSECQDPAALPEDWKCILNSNNNFACCSSPQEEWENSSQDFVYSKFTPGSIVWAKMAGYPAWPAMVDCEPDYDIFCETFADGNVSRYHVVFLDDRVSRAWISHRDIEIYRVDETPVKLSRVSQKGGFIKDLDGAKRRAQDALKMMVPERRNKFSFQNRFRGKSYWSCEKYATEKKLKHKSRAESNEPNVKHDKAKHPDEYKVSFEPKSMTSTPCKKELCITENREKKDSSHVSASEDEVSGCLEKEEFGNLFVDVAVKETIDHSDEIPFDQTASHAKAKNVFNEATDKREQIDPDIFTMEMGEHQGEECQLLDLSQKKISMAKTDTPECNGNGSLRRDISSDSQDEYWLAPENETSVPVESLFEDVDMRVVDGALQEPSEADWEEFSELVLAE